MPENPTTSNAALINDTRPFRERKSLCNYKPWSFFVVGHDLAFNDL